jgi:hypothetical protein
MASKLVMRKEASCTPAKSFTKLSEIADGKYTMSFTGQVRQMEDKTEYALIDLKGPKSYRAMIIGVPADLIKVVKNKVTALCKSFKLVKEGASITFIPA